LFALVKSFSELSCFYHPEAVGRAGFSSPKLSGRLLSMAFSPLCFRGFPEREIPADLQDHDAARQSLNLIYSVLEDESRMP
jgi:hypothetical protein